jgi:hypothetical protein
MARVIVLPNAVNLAEGFIRSVVLDERIDPVHLEDEDASLQFIERVAWAIQDAEGREVATSCTTHRRKGQIELLR